jgi:hypothetical protein
MGYRFIRQGESAAVDWVQWGRDWFGAPYFAVRLPSWQWAYRPYANDFGWVQAIVIWSKRCGWFTSIV